MLHELFKDLTRDELTVVVALAGFVGLLVTNCIGILSTWLITRFTKRSDDRKHFRELGLEIAMTEWKSSLEYAEQLAKATKSRVPMPPLECYFVHGFQIMELLSGPRLSAEDMGNRLGMLREYSVRLRHVIETSTPEMLTKVTTEKRSGE